MATGSFSRLVLTHSVLSYLVYRYKYGSNKRSYRRHQLMDRAPEVEADDEEEVYEGDSVDCDEICEQRKSQLLDLDDDDLETRDAEPEAEAEAEPEFLEERDIDEIEA